MSELQNMQITPLQGWHHFYKVLSSEDRSSGRSILDSHLFTPGELLDLAAWVEQNRTRLEQEAQEEQSL